MNKLWPPWGAIFIVYIMQIWQCYTVWFVLWWYLPAPSVSMWTITYVEACVEFFQRFRLQTPDPEDRSKYTTTPMMTGQSNAHTCPAHHCWQQLQPSASLLVQILSLSTQRSPAWSLWLIYRQRGPGEQRSLTSPSSSVATKPLKFALISTAAAESCCREGAGAGGGAGWGVGGVGCVNANVTNMKMDYYSIQSSSILGKCTGLKIVARLSCHWVSFKGSWCFVAN